MEDSISKKLGDALSVLHFVVFLQYDRKYYRKYLDNGYMKINRPQSKGRGGYGLSRSIDCSFPLTGTTVSSLSIYLDKHNKAP